MTEKISRTKENKLWKIYKSLKWKNKEYSYICS